MVRVRPISDDDLDDLIDRAEKLFAEAARKSFNAAASRIRHPTAMTAAGDDQFISYDDAGVAHTVWTEQLVTLTPVVEEAFEAAAFGVIGGIGDAVLPAAAQTGLIFPAVLDQASVTHLQQAKNRMAHFGQAAWNDVRKELDVGFRAGEGIDEMTKRIQSAGNLTAERARTVARTEVISASNAGAFAAARTMPPVLQPELKEWLSTSDARTRPDHAAADGQQRKLDEKFTVGGASLAYPGDPHGPPGEIINCRCTVLFDVEPVSCTCAEPALAASALLAAASTLNQADTAFAQARIALGIGRKALADKLGWPIHKLYQIEFGKKDPSPSDLAKLFSVPGYQDAFNVASAGGAPKKVTVSPGEDAIGNCACTKTKAKTPKPAKPKVTKATAPVVSPGLKPAAVSPSFTPDDLAELSPARSNPITALKRSRDGEGLLKRLRDFTGSGTSRLRADIRSFVLRGATPTPDVRRVLDAIAMSPIDPPKVLYRGMRISGDNLRTYRTTYQVGNTVDMDIASFSSSQQKAQGFGMTSPPNRSMYVELVGDKKALPLERISAFPSEREWITSGRFRVVEVIDTPNNGPFRVKLQHEAILDSADGSLRPIGQTFKYEPRVVAPVVPRGPVLTSKGVDFDDLFASTSFNANADIRKSIFYSVDHNTLPSYAEAARQMYRQSGGRLNKALRGLTPVTQELANKIDEMARAFATAGTPVQRDAILFRSIDRSFAEEIVAKGELVDKGYVTATLRRQPSTIYDSVEVQIFVPEGTKIMPIAGAADEVVLQQGSSFKVLGFDPEANVLKLEKVG